MNSLRPGHPPSPPPRDELRASHVLAVLGLTLLAFLLVQMLLMFFAGATVITDTTSTEEELEALLNDSAQMQDLAERMLLLIGEGVSAWPAIMKLTWMLNQAVIALPVFLVLYVNRFSIRKHLRLHPVPPRFLGYAAVIGASMVIISDEITRIIAMIKPLPPELEEAIRTMLTAETGLDWFVIFTTVTVVAAFSEELLFRGFLQRWAERRMGVTQGALAVAAMFALIHGEWFFLIPILVLATFLAAMTWRVESIYPAVVAHGMNNALGFFAANYTGESDPAWYTLGDHVAPWWVALAIGLIYYCLKKFFEDGDRLGLGGHGPSGDSGYHLDKTA